MHLHVILLLDICTGNGTAINKSFWDCTGIADHHLYQWPWTHLPTPSDTALWQCSLTQSLNLGRERHLSIPLGKWLSRMQKVDGRFMDAEGEQLYRQCNKEWYTYVLIPLQR